MLLCFSSLPVSLLIPALRGLSQKYRFHQEVGKKPFASPGATLEKRQKAVNKGYHDRTWKLDSELHGSQQDQRGPIESEVNEYGHRGRVLAPVIGRYGDASSDLSLNLDLVAREMARKHTAFYNTGFSEAKALFRQKLARKWGHAIARGWATLLLDRLRDFAVDPSFAGGTLLLSGTLRAWRSVPLWTATITSMATRACAPD